MSDDAEPEILYDLPAAVLADWLDKQGEDRWWNVDGDPTLMGRLSPPCPGDELSAELRRIGRPLILHHPIDVGTVRSIASPDQLDPLVRLLGDVESFQGEPQDWAKNRLLVLSWSRLGDPWMLIEDREATESSREDAATTSGGQ